MADAENCTTFTSSICQPRRCARHPPLTFQPTSGLRLGMGEVALYGILPYTGGWCSMPTTTNSTDERLEARISTEQKRLFKEAATLRGVTLTDFVVSSVHEAAVRTLEARHVIELSQSDQRAFVDALSRPPAPNSVLRKAWARHSASAARSRKRRLAKRAR
jgi:uncharacterized protein (DUF1778 family)